MNVNKDLSLKVAELLLKTKAVRLQPDQPFTWASGWKSPIYCDNRITLSFPEVRTHIRQGYAQTILDNFGKPDVIAGVATGGIAQGALIAQELGLPFIYVRPKPKEHGLGNQIEGFYEAGQKAVVVEDLISTGKSSLQVVDVLRQNNIEVIGMVSIFQYGFETAATAFKQAGVPCQSLTSYPVLVEMAIQKGLIPASQQSILIDWSTDPANWKGV
jgi:orotate phosphoribosyltransferase